VLDGELDADEHAERDRDQHRPEQHVSGFPHSTAR
jgi:hypothetical protein